MIRYKYLCLLDNEKQTSWDNILNHLFRMNLFFWWLSVKDLVACNTFIRLCISIFISVVVVPRKRGSVFENLMMFFLLKYTNYYVRQNRHHRGPQIFWTLRQRT